MPRSAGPNWGSALDFERALINCHRDFLGDWYRDPWGWPELDWILASGRTECLFARLNTDGIKHTARLDVIKENFAVRPAVVMDPVDRLAFQSLVDSVSRRLIGSMRPWVFGWRLEVRSPRKGAYAENEAEWGRYRKHIGGLANFFEHALRTDVVSFFGSVPVERVIEGIQSDVGNNAITKRIAGMLRGWDGMHDRSGLPQRSAAAAVLANYYLRPLDEALARYNSIRGVAASFAPLGTAARWMDDIWLFGRGPGRLRKAQLHLMDELRQLGLEMNMGKTSVLDDNEVVEDAQRIEHSAVDSALSALPKDPRAAAPLDELIDRLLTKPEMADRTSVRFATTRMRANRLFGRVDDFRKKTHRMPHCADILARLFRDSGQWEALQSWYPKYAASSWAVSDWSVAQLGTMFPSSRVGSGEVRDYLAERLIGHPPLEIAGLASQRLPAWDRDVAIESMREAAKVADTPQVRRVLALGSATAREERVRVRKLLSEFEENAVTLAFLDARQYRPVKPKPDFEGN